MNREQIVEYMGQVVNEILGDDWANDILNSAYEKASGKSFPDDEAGEEAQDAWCKEMDECLNDALVQIGKSIEGSRNDAG